mgnify:CR=1 FL=1
MDILRPDKLVEVGGIEVAHVLNIDRNPQPSRSKNSSHNNCIRILKVYSNKVI